MDTRVRTVEGVPEVSEGDDLAGMLRGRIGDADLVAVASTVVSKSEGRVRRLDAYTPSERARELARGLDDGVESKDPRFAQAVLKESTEILLETPFLLAVTRFGHIAPNAGVDRSNVRGDDRVLLLPEDPDASADRLSDRLDTPVVVTDTCGRPFRRGQTGVAVGWSGVSAILDWRGEEGMYGHELEATEEAVLDEVAAYANLQMGEGGGGTPAVAFEGVRDALADADDDVLFRPEEDDVIREALRERESAGHG